MVETKVQELAKQLQPLITKWDPKAQEDCADICIATWSQNNWGENELTILETSLEEQFRSTNSFGEKIE